MRRLLGVTKVETESDLEGQIKLLLDDSDLVGPSSSSPRRLIKGSARRDRQPLYACKYYICPTTGRSSKATGWGTGITASLRPSQSSQRRPRRCGSPWRAANLIGNGLYGVDVKQSGDQYYVIEVNDNPNIDAGVEDAILKQEIYRRIMAVFLRRIECAARRGSRPMIKAES